MKIDHLGVAVRSVEEAAAFWEEALGLKLSRTEEVASEAVRVGFLPLGGTRLELLEPLSPGSPVARHLDRRGEGLHHLCIEVEDLEAAVERVRARGGELIEPAIRPGAGGSRVAFVHPRSARGLLLELREGGAAAPAAFPAPGAVAVLYLADPPAKVWGRIARLDGSGVVIRGVDLRSFEDLLRGAAAGEMGAGDLSVVFYPLRRVEKMILDVGSETAPSLQEQFAARVGRSFAEFVGE